MRVYLRPRPLEPELDGQRRLAIRPLISSVQEIVFERRAPCPFPTLEPARSEFLFRYEIFPERVLRAWGEWQSEGRAMRAGDTVVQEAAMPPFPWGARLLFGARITAVKREASAASFSYATLTSHAETGVNTFGLKLERGQAVAWISSRAEPGNPLMRLAGPVVMRYSDWCKEQAVQQMLARFLTD